MRDDLLAFFAAREEPVVMGGRTYTVKTRPDDAAPASPGNDEPIYDFVVRCTFDEEGKLAFTDEDIPALKASPQVLKARLLRAVMRVNGFDSGNEEKNSEAGPSSG